MAVPSNLATAANGDETQSAPILVMTEVFPPQIGGSGRWLFEVFTRVTTMGPVYVLSPPLAAASEGDMVIPNRVRSVREYCKPQEAGFFVPKGGLEYLRILRIVARLHRKHRFQRVYCGSCLTPGWVAWLFQKLFRVPYVCFVHGEEVFRPEDGKVTGTLSSRQLRLQTRLVIQSASCLIANSHNTGRILQSTWGVTPDRLRVHNPGVDASQFVPCERSEQVRAELGWADRRVVLTVGRLQRRKGHDMMIRAIPSIRDAVPDILYVIVGDGEELESLKRLVEECGVTPNVQFRTAAADEELLACYQQCDLFVLPNRQIGADIEGFGIVLLEAQACGKPVVAGASGGTQETLCEGRTGLTIPCDSPELLAATVAGLLCDKTKLSEMGVAARKWIEERFDWNRLAARFERDMAE